MRVLALCLLAPAAVAVGPIEKVVQLLNQLKGQVQNDQESEAKAFDEQDKWCRSTVKDKEFAIETATDKIEQKTACIEAKSGIAAAKSAEIEELGKNIGQLERDLKNATAIREDEHKSFKAADSELTETVDALERAVVILKRSGVGKTAQAQAAELAQVKKRLGLLAATLSTIVSASSVSYQSSQKLQQFLQQDPEGGSDFENPQAAAYEGHSGGILDLLEDLRDKADESQQSARKQEMESKHSYEMLKQDVTDEIAYSKKELAEAQRVRSTAEEAQSGCEEAKATNEKARKEDAAYLEELKTSCAAQEEEYNRNSVSRQEECEAIDKAIEILTGDGAQASMGRLGTSLLQTSSMRSRNVHKASTLLNKLGRKLHSVALTQVAYRMMVADPADPFGKVKGMIAEMIARLESEAAEEATHKAWCDEETTKNKESLSKSKNRLDTLNTRIEKNSAAIATLHEEIKQLEEQIATIDQNQADATRIRSDNKAANEQQIKDATEAEAAIAQAMKVLRDYYSGKSADAAAAMLQRKLPSAVQGRDYSQNADAATGIIGILEVSQSDFLNVATETKALEEQQSNDFRDLSNKNKVSRATKVAEVKGKRSEIKSIENSKASTANDLDNEQDNYDALSEYKAKLKQNCEYTAPSFEERAAQRQSEIDGLKEALKILDGESVATDEAFVQEKVRVLRGAKAHF